MKDLQDNATSPSQPQHTPLPRSQFNEAEYQRWSEKLRTQYGRKNEENQRPGVDARTWITDSIAQEKD
jgi:hypothetical protein